MTPAIRSIFGKTVVLFFLLVFLQFVPGNWAGYSGLFVFCLIIPFLVRRLSSVELPLERILLAIFNGIVVAAVIYFLLWMDRSYRNTTFIVYFLAGIFAAWILKKTGHFIFKSAAAAALSIFALGFLSIWFGNLVVLFRNDTILQTMFFVGWFFMIFAVRLDIHEMFLNEFQAALFIFTGFAAIFFVAVGVRPSPGDLGTNVKPILSSRICDKQPIVYRDSRFQSLPRRHWGFNPDARYDAYRDSCFRAISHPYDMAVSGDGEDLFIAVQSPVESLFKIPLRNDYASMPFHQPYLNSLNLHDVFKGKFSELNATRIALAQDTHELWYPIVETKPLPNMPKDKPGAVLVIDEDTLEIKKIFPAPLAINSMTLSPGSDLAVTVSLDQRDSPGGIEIFDVKTKNRIASLPYGDEIRTGGFTGYSIDIDQKLNRIFATSYANGKILALNFPDGKLILKKQISRSLQRLEVDQDRHLLYIADPIRGCIHVMDGLELKLVDRIPVSLGVREIRLDPIGRYLYCGSFTTGALEVVNVDSRKKVASYKILRGIRGVYFDEPRKRVYVSAPGLIARVDVQNLYHP